MVNGTESTPLTRTATLAHLAQEPLRTADGIYFPNGKTQITVQMLTIRTRYDESTTLHGTEELARDHLYEHVSYWWEQQNEPEDFDGFDRDAAIDKYFEQMDDEYWEIDRGKFDLADIIT